LLKKEPAGCRRYKQKRPGWSRGAVINGSIVPQR
jgi:hypothetical protein